MPDIKPMSKKRRFLFFILFLVVFVIVAPLIVLYSSGYSISFSGEEEGWGLSIARTGGIFISVPESGATVTLSGLSKKTTNFLLRDIFFDRLPPRTYAVEVEKPGLKKWVKNVKVFPEIVSEAYPFLLPEKIDLKEIGQLTTISNGHSTTSVEYLEAKEMFDAKDELMKENSISTTSTSTTIFLNVKKKIAIDISKQGVEATWTGDKNDSPFYFCEQTEEGKVCESKVLVYESQNVKTVDFYPDRKDIYIIAAGSRILITELDIRPPQNSFYLYEGNKPDFVLKGGTVFIKDGAKYFKVDF